VKRWPRRLSAWETWASGYDAIAEIDINPLIVCGDKPVAVDALVVLK